MNRKFWLFLTVLILIISAVSIIYMNFTWAQPEGSLNSPDQPLMDPRIKISPRVTTQSAANIGSTSAVLNGILNDLGTAKTVTVWFEYGTSTSYGKSTSSQSFKSLQTFRASVSDLSPNTTYYFRARADGDGSASGGNMSFKTANQFIIVASAGPGGAISPSGNVAVDAGADQSFSISPSAGNSIAGVSVDGSSMGAITSYVFYAVSTNHTIAASFTQNYTLAINIMGQGSVTKNPNQTYYSPGSSVTLTAAPEKGWAFGGWSGDLSGAANPATLTLNGSKTVSATFTLIPSPTPPPSSPPPSSSSPPPAPPPLPPGNVGVVSQPVIPPPPMLTPLTLSGFNTAATLRVDVKGFVQDASQLQSTDGKLFINIEAKTQLLDADGKTPLRSLSCRLPDSKYDAPSGKIVLMDYVLDPLKAQFNPAIKLSMKYNRDQLPAGVNEDNLSLAYWDQSWVLLSSQVDKENQTVSAPITHFSDYALLVAAPPPPPPPLAPASFTLSDLKVAPAEVNPGTPVAIQISVCNIGGLPGQFKVSLNVNGTTENTRTNTLESGKFETVVFQITKNTPGLYNFDINGTTTGQFKILQPPENVLAPPTTPTAVKVERGEPSPTVVREPVAAPSVTAAASPTSSTSSSLTSNALMPVIWIVILLALVIPVIIEIILIRRKRQ